MLSLTPLFHTYISPKWNVWRDQKTDGHISDHSALDNNLLFIWQLQKGLVHGCHTQEQWHQPYVTKEGSMQTSKMVTLVQTSPLTWQVNANLGVNPTKRTHVFCGRSGLERQCIHYYDIKAETVQVQSKSTHTNNRRCSVGWHVGPHAVCKFSLAGVIIRQW